MNRRALLLAAAAAALLATSSTVPAQAGAEPNAVQQETTCEDGYGVAHVQLVAADGADTTFTSVVRNRTTGAEVRDEDHVVPAGQTADVALPGLLKGSYVLNVRVDEHLVLGGSVTVSCTPTHPYKQPYWVGLTSCDHTSTITLHNDAIKGSEDLLEKVHFVVRLKNGKTYFEGDLPDDDAHPYTEDVFISDKGQLLVTADGQTLESDGFPAAACEPIEPKLPETGF